MADIARRYGENPDPRSRGEAFLNLFRARFVPDGLYLLDEPEAALFDRTPVAPVAYDDMDHVRLTRDFLQDPGRFLRHLG